MVLIGAVIGLAFGLLLFFLLMKIVRAVTGGGKMPILLMLAQPFLILAGLVLCLLIDKSQLIFAGGAMVLCLIAGSVISVFMMKKRASDRVRDGNEGDEAK